ncbi:MAG: SusC/RagA family TonB-linked outer membrane protein [Williamsia sp.]|nr:SusC/RagA family TonB-linked outer membrane protein [Williamsia sp.]
MKSIYKALLAPFFVIAGCLLPGVQAQTGNPGPNRETGTDTGRSSLSLMGVDGKNEEVAIPFGSRPKRHLPGVISVLRSEQLPQVPYSNLNEALTGLLPGVYVSKQNTAPGYDASNILIRGRSSYNDAQPPLVLVDGIERDFADMDLSEIESIGILKDAASLAWYGIRGANGVVLVTTKHGNTAGTKVTLSGMGGAQLARANIKPLDSYTYATLYNEALQNGGLAPLYDQTALNAYKSGSDPYAYPNNNFVDRFIKKWAPVQRYVAAVSGGNEAAKYFTTFSYYNQGGLFAETQTPNYNSNAGYKRYNFRSNLDATVTKNLDVSVNIGGRIENRAEPGQNTAYAGITDLLNAIYLTPPNAYPLLNQDSSYGGNTIFQNNPLAQLQSRGYNSQITRVLLASARANYKLDGITKGLSLTAMYSYDMAGVYISGRTQNFEVYQRNPATGAYTRFGTRASLAYRAASFANTSRNNELWAGLNYKRTFGAHSLDIAGYYNGASVFNPIGNIRFDYNRKSASTRVSYDFRHRYLADLVLNYSGNVRFAENHRYGFFPALSAGWIISEEDFLKEIKPLNYLKLRGSYGLTGNDNLFNARLYGWQSLYSTAGFQSYSFGTGFSSAGGATGELSLPNPDLTFEKSRKLDLGFEARLLSALSITWDYFLDKRTDLISPSFIPGFIGQGLVPGNSGEAQYKGFETSLGFNKKWGLVNLNLFVNYTLAKTNLNSYNDQPGLPKYQLQTGHPLANLGRMFVAEGIFQNQNEITAAPRSTLSGKVQPGDIRYKDLNGDGLIDNFDQTVLDYTGVPASYYSFGAAVSVAGFDLSAMMTGQHGGSADIRSIIYAGNANNGFLNQYSVDRWNTTNGAGALYPRLTLSDRGNNTALSTFWIRSTDFLQLRNVELGYTLPGSLMKKLKLSACRLYINGYNLLSFSKLNDLDLDPALISAGRNAVYPSLTTLSAGLNLTF